MNPLVPALRAYFKSIGDDLVTFGPVHPRTAKVAKKLGFSNLTAVRFKGGEAFEVVGLRNGQAEVFDEAVWTRATVRQFGLTHAEPPRPTPPPPAAAKRAQEAAPARPLPPFRPPSSTATYGQWSGPRATPAGAAPPTAVPKAKGRKFAALRRKLKGIRARFGKGPAKAPAPPTPTAAFSVPPPPRTAAPLRAKATLEKRAAAAKQAAAQRIAAIEARERAELQRARQDSLAELELDEAIRRLSARSKEFAEYLTVMRHPGSDPTQWGGEGEVVAAARLYGVVINVYDQSLTEPNRAKLGLISELEAPAEVPVINLLRVDGNHYSVLTEAPVAESFDPEQWRRESKVANVTGDGNCFFRAVALSLNRQMNPSAEPIDHVKVRRQVALYQAENGSEEVRPGSLLTYESMALDPHRTAKTQG